MPSNYAAGATAALRRLALTKTAAPWSGAFSKLTPLLAKGARMVSGWAGSAAKKLEPPASGLVDPHGNPVSSGRRASEPAEGAAVSKPGLIRQAFRNRNKGYVAANGIGGYFSNEREDTPTSERLWDAGVGMGTNMLMSKVPFLPREASAISGMLAVPLARQLRKD